MLKYLFQLIEAALEENSICLGKRIQIDEGGGSKETFQDVWDEMMRETPDVRIIIYFGEESVGFYIV